MDWRLLAEESAQTLDRAFSERAPSRRVAAAAFGVIFFAQWGDPMTVFAGATAALWSVSGLAVLAGRFSNGRFHARGLQRAAAVVFAAAGAWLLIQSLGR